MYKCVYVYSCVCICMHVGIGVCVRVCVKKIEIGVAMEISTSHCRGCVSREWARRGLRLSWYNYGRLSFQDQPLQYQHFVYSMYTI